MLSLHKVPPESGSAKPHLSDSRFNWKMSPDHTMPAHAVPVVIRLAMGAPLPGWQLLMAPLIEAVLWPMATAILLAPQRRSNDVDETRPI